MTHKLCLAVALLLAAPAAFSQDAPPPPPAAPHSAAQPNARVFQFRKEGGHIEMHEGGGMPIEIHRGDHMPGGTWWRNSEMVTQIGLSADQVKRMEDVFTQSKIQLIDLHASLQKEELVLEPLMRANPVDQGKALAQVNKIADTRAELEKANAKMLLSIRSILTADQWTKLETHHRAGGPGGPGAPHVMIYRKGDGPGAAAPQHP